VLCALLAEFPALEAEAAAASAADLAAAASAAAALAAAFAASMRASMSLLLQPEAAATITAAAATVSVFTIAVFIVNSSVGWNQASQICGCGTASGTHRSLYSSQPNVRETNRFDPDVEDCAMRRSACMARHTGTDH
jgi:hypothetical protein